VTSTHYKTALSHTSNYQHTKQQVCGRTPVLTDMYTAYWRPHQSGWEWECAQAPALSVKKFQFCAL